MGRETRIYWQNLFNLANTTVQASSYESAMPPAFARDPQLSKVWRSKRGWNFVRLVNDSLCLDEGGVKRIAFLTPGNYATGALAAAAVQDAMNGAGVDPRSLSASLWLRADSLLPSLADGDAVSQWNDESGNARHLTQSTADAKPVFHRSIINGRPALYFDGAGDRLENVSATLGDLISSTAGCWFVVFHRPSTASGAATIFGGDDSENTLRLDGSGNLVARCDDGAQKEASKAAADGAWHIGMWFKDGSSNICAAVDDQDTAALESTAAGAIASLAETLVLGSDGTSHLEGYVAEVIVFPTSLDEENRRRVTAYLVQKYGIDDDTSDPSWSNTYQADYASSKFTLSRAAGAESFSLLWSTGLYAGRGIGEDLGYDTSSDDSGETGYEADAISQHSREWLRYDLESVMTASDAKIAGHLPGSTGASLRIQGNNVDDWTDPALDAELAADSADQIREASFTAQTLRFWRILIDDAANANGFSQLGVRYLGEFFQPLRSARIGYRDARDDLSQFARGSSGSYFSNKKNLGGEWQIEVEMLPKTEKAALDQIQRVIGVGGVLWITLDMTETRYCVLLESLKWRHHQVTNAEPPDFYSTAIVVGEVIE